MPQYDAGMRIEPAVSVPSAKSTSPPATAAAEPAETKRPGGGAGGRGFGVWVLRGGTVVGILAVKRKRHLVRNGLAEQRSAFVQQPLDGGRGCLRRRVCTFPARIPGAGDKSLYIVKFLYRKGQR